MNRRASYPARQEEDLVVPQWKSDILNHRPSVGQNLGLDWSKTGGKDTYTPLEFKYEAVDVMDLQNDRRQSTVRLVSPRDEGNQLKRQMEHLRTFNYQRSRRFWERIVIAVLAICLVLSLVWRGGGTRTLLEKAKIRGLGPKSPLKSTIPLHSFRANLIPNHGYVTSFPYGGLTNQLIEQFKLVHLAHLLNRAAVLTELHSVHGEGVDVPLSLFFDLSSFSYYSNVSMTEWRQLKLADVPGTQNERLSCWGWRDERPLSRYNIHTDFWPPPGQLTVPSSIETSMTFPAIQVLVSQSQEEWLTSTAIRYFGSVENAPPMPDKQLLCFENLFYVPSLKFVEGSVDQTYSIEEMSPEDPVWNKVGRHLRFNAHINKIADELIYSLLGNQKKFIAVHIRQGDFITLGRVSASVVESYSVAVDVVQAELTASGKSKSWAGKKKRLPVVFATDSEDPVFIRKLVELGWVYIDHKEFATTTRFGGWYPGVLDSLILSRSIGFVGTKLSTFSYVAARRVEAWNGGITKIVG